jgi:tRNA wybutosine-synthesizing protein 2
VKVDQFAAKPVRVLAVPRARAAELLRELHAHRIVDRTHRTAKRDGEVLIPVVGDPPLSLAAYDARWDDRETLPVRQVPRDPWDSIRRKLATAGIRPEVVSRRWKRIGDVIVLRIPSEARREACVIAGAFGSTLNARTVVRDRSGVHGGLRTPDMEVLWGDGTETVHVEGGVHYALDVAKVMFSPGNIEERMGMARRIPPGAVVVDLFAGIGYFALPIAVHGRAGIVYACELNPVGYAYLLRNIRLNRAHNVVPLQGDCRDVAPRGVADWVIAGHFDARAYLDVAFASLRGKGTIVYHELCPKEQYPDAVTRRLAAASRAHWMDVISIRTRTVKSYAPGIVHAAAELAVAPQTRRRTDRNKLE